MLFRRVLVVGVVAVATLVALPGTAGAAGITTHRWMAETAIGQVTDPALGALLEQNLTMVQTGAGFPDVGYAGDNTYGETAHWQRFVDNLIDAIRARPDCGDLTAPTGPCAGLIAFTFGVAAHGMGDEVWDWLFEPNSPDHDEYWTGVPTATEDGAETQMDLVAIGRYGVARPASGTVPDEPLVLHAFVDSGKSGVTASQFDLVPMLPVLWDAEKSWADDHLTDLEAAMPWMSAHLVTAPGGVDFAATAIAGYWESEWGRLVGDQPPTRVSITYPAPGQTDVPATGWDRDAFLPGTSRGRGGARNRIAAVLTSARPYVGADGGLAVSDALPTGSMTITDLTTGVQVPLKSSYPRSVPYGSDSGEHTIDTQPAANLDTCTWYRVDVSGAVPVLDARGEPVTAYSWRFRTECDDPPPPSTTTTTAPAPTTTVPSVPTTTVPSVPTTTLPAPTTSTPATAPPTAPATTVTPAPTTSLPGVDTTTPTVVGPRHVGTGSSPRPAALPATPLPRSPAYTG